MALFSYNNVKKLLPALALIALVTLAGCSKAPALTPAPAPAPSVPVTITPPPVISTPPAPVTTPPPPAVTPPPVITTPPPAPPPVSPPIPTPTPTPGKPVTIDLVAQNVAFNMNNISVAAGAAVAVNFNNKDSGVPHNFAVYQNLPGGQTNPVFIGGTITGPASVVYRFTAPAAPGNYFFECDVHPQMMNGTFVVQ